MAAVNIRELVADSLLEMEKNNTYLSVLESAVLDKYAYLEARDRAFYKRLLDGTTEYRIRIDYVIGLYSKTGINKLKPYIRAILRMSVYQIMWMESVPDSAVCNEAVKLAVKHGLGGLKGFVNGVLRNISRNKSHIALPDREKDPVFAMSVEYSCPEWIVEKLISENGQADAELILKESLEEHPLSVRLRCSGNEADELIAGWTAAGMEVKDNPYLEYGKLVRGGGSVADMPGFAEGMFTVQDTGSMLVAHLAGIRPGDTVVDVCAAPGGKSIHASDILAGTGRVLSFDISEDRCDRIRENAQRLGAGNVEAACHDAAVFMPELEGKADVVIADVPCSGIGVMGHKSDIKYRLKPEDIDGLHGLQRRIIDTAVRYVRPGGRFVYSTCTISRQENVDQAEYIKKKYGFKPVLPVIPGKTDVTECLQLIPGKDESDGFFIGVFSR